MCSTCHQSVPGTGGTLHGPTGKKSCVGARGESAKQSAGADTSHAKTPKATTMPKTIQGAPPHRCTHLESLENQEYLEHVDCDPKTLRLRSPRSFKKTTEQRCGWQIVYDVKRLGCSPLLRDSETATASEKQSASDSCTRHTQLTRRTHAEHSQSTRRAHRPQKANIITSAFKKLTPEITMKFHSLFVDFTSQIISRL